MPHSGSSSLHGPDAHHVSLSPVKERQHRDSLFLVIDRGQIKRPKLKEHC